MKRLAPEHRYCLIDHRRHPMAFRDAFETVIIDLPRHPLGITRWIFWEVSKVLQQFDLVFSPGLYGPFRIPAGVASVMVVHDLTRTLFPQFFPFNPVQKVLDRLAYPAMVGRYDHLLAVSEATRKDLMTLFKVPEEKITVAYHGAEEAFQPRPEMEVQEKFLKTQGLKKPYILFLGTIEPRKNIPALLKAFAGIRDQIPQDLVLVGQRGWKWEPIFEEIKRLKIQSRVHWVGYVPDEDRVLFYNGADFLVYPSWYEGFGMPLLEAMQCGCPVIASKVSSLPEVVGEAGLLVDPGNFEALQRAMLRLIREPGLAEKMRQAGFEQARHFSWEDSARKTLAVFETLLRK